jgi:hypothetical protein
MNEVSGKIHKLSTDVLAQLAKQMNSNQITEAQERAKKCASNNFKDC